MSITINPRQRARLKARAHSLEPFVQIGQSGISDAVVTETERALTAHGLIKVRLNAGDRAARAELAEELCRRTDATPVQSVGRVLVLWRPRPEDEPIAR